MQVLRHRLIDPSGNPVAGHTANVMEYETPEEAYYRGYRRVPIVTAVSDDNGWLTWLLPRTVSNVYAVSGIEPLPVIVTVPYGVPAVTVTEARTGVVTGGGVRAPATVDLVTELELSVKLAGMTRDLVGELVLNPSFLAELAESPGLLDALVARPELAGTPDPTPNVLVKRDDFGAAAVVALSLSNPPQLPDSAVRKDYVDELGSAEAMPSTVMRRNAGGNSAIQGLWLLDFPNEDPHWAAPRGYVDGVGTAVPEPDTIMRRDGTGRTQTTGISGMDELGGDLTTIARTVAATVGFVKDWVASIGTALRTASTLVRRDAAGGAEFSRVYVDTAPVGADELTRKDYVDGEIANTGDDQNTPNTLVRRDVDGGFWGDRVYVNQAPANPYDATRKDYVDALGTAAVTPNTVVRRDASGNTAIDAVTLTDAPTDASHATRKSYVDGLGTQAATANTVVRRDGNGTTDFTRAYSTAFPPTADAELTRKDYVDAGDTAAKNRVNHTGTQTAATIADLTETVQDIVAALIVAGTGVTVTYDDAAGTYTINSTAVGGTTDPEIVRDVIGTAMVAGAGIQITVNDAGDTLTVASTAVLPTRQVISGTGLTGGGDLSADRTLAVTYGTAAGTAAQGNDSRIIGAVQTTRSVISGTGLSGGGTLAADRTLAVSYGSTAGTAVQGNDARVVADQVAGTASIRTLGTGAQQAAAGNHTHSGMVTGTGITAMQSLSQQAFDAIVTKSGTTLYVIVG